MISRHPLARATLALALLASPIAAQECVDDYLATRSGAEYLTQCDAVPNSQVPCVYPTFSVYRVEGGLDELQRAIGQLPPFVSGFTVIEVGPDAPPTDQELYNPIYIQASQFPDGLAIISRWGPTKAAIVGNGTGPCITIDGVFGSSSIRIGAVTKSLRLDAAGNPTYEGWHGFEIREGAGLPFPGLDGGGIRVNYLDDELDIAGNVIHDNLARNFGGGVHLLGVTRAFVSANHIHDNIVADQCQFDGQIGIKGAGIMHINGALDLIGNRIEHNGFGGDACYPMFTVRARQGGGVASEITSTSWDSAFVACGNEVFENQASEGGGIWVDAFADERNVPVRIELNEIRGNSTWAPQVSGTPPITGAFRGGGIWIRGRSAQVTSPSDPRTLQIEVVSNRISANEVTNPGFAVATTPDEVGGGIYSDVERNDKSDVVAIVGNAVWSNKVARFGAGLWIHHPTATNPPVSGDLHHNTIAFNSVVQAGNTGSGIYLTSATRFDGSSSVIFHNAVAGVSGQRDGDWFAEAGVPDRFRFTQMPSGFLNSANLFGPNCSSANPGLSSGDWHLASDASFCVESAESSPAFEIELAGLGLTYDADGGPRAIDRAVPYTPSTLDDRDRGADERLTFLRGDANWDGMVNLADAVFILNYGQSGGPAPKCLKAADVNDDGSVDIADPMMIMDYFMPPLPIVPPDFMMCTRLDPTPDGLAWGPGSPSCSP